MLIVDVYGIGSKKISVDDGRSILGVTSMELAEDLGARRVKLPWEASMAGVGGPLSWDVAAYKGTLALDHIASEYPFEGLVLLGYSGGCKVVHDWLDTRPEHRDRVKAVGLMSDPFRPYRRSQHGLPDPGGYGIAGQRLGPIPGRTFWTSNPRDVISSCPIDSPLRTLADLSDRIPGGFLDDFAGHMRLNSWQLANHIKMWKRDPLGYLNALPRRMHEARLGVEGYLTGAHTTAYTRGDPSLAIRLARSMAWALNGGSNR